MEIFESVNTNNLAVTNIALSGDYIPLTDTYVEAVALAHLSGNIFLLTDIDQSLYKITTAGVGLLLGVWTMFQKGLPSFLNPPVTLMPMGKPILGSTAMEAGISSFLGRLGDISRLGNRAGPTGAGRLRWGREDGYSGVPQWGLVHSSLLGWRDDGSRLGKRGGHTGAGRR